MSAGNSIQQRRGSVGGPFSVEENSLKELVNEPSRGAAVYKERRAADRRYGGQRPLWAQ